MFRRLSHLWRRLKRLGEPMPNTPNTIAASIHSTWAARGRMPAVVEIEDAMGEAYESGRKAGAIEVFERLSERMRQSYKSDRRLIPYFEAVEQALAVAHNELTNCVGEEIVSVT
jgi:hypothetical protein